LSNLKEVELALTFYTNDNDGRTPERDRWMDTSEPYMENPEIEHCPEVKAPALYGYAINAGVTMLNDKDPRAETTPLVYDSVDLAKNASDLATSMPQPGRHQGCNNVAFVDGHAKSVEAGYP